ncbi:MAG: DUF354 domain-containing protein [Phycisphaerae bacterium]|nr:DUF354 domain-containing protein [Phycisphaerae bacterium]
MKIIFDLGHPAHFHLFKNVIKRLIENGHGCEIIARDKECLVDLIEKAGFAYHVVKRTRNGLIPLAIQNFKAFLLATTLARKQEIDFIVGTSIIAGPAARLTGAISIIFEEDDAKAVPLLTGLAYPPAHYIATPQCLSFENYGRKHLTYNGYHELAYLHPGNFTPDDSVLKELGVSPGQRYFLIRLVALKAHHDIGEKGVSTQQAKTLIGLLKEHGRVFISAEKAVDKDIEQYLLPTNSDRILDVMAFCDMVIGDSQTMAAEAAVLGVPSIRCNTFVGRLAYLEELENKYGLTYGFLPSDFDKLLEMVGDLLAKNDLKKIWQDKRQKMLEDCIDLSEWIYDQFCRLKKGKLTDPKK